MFKDVSPEHRLHYGIKFLMCLVLQQEDLYKHKWSWDSYSSHKKTEDWSVKHAALILYVCIIEALLGIKIFSEQVWLGTISILEGTRS